MEKKWKIAGINFAHMHMGDNLRMVHEHPKAEIVGICDENVKNMKDAVDNFGLSKEKVFTDYKRCIEQTEPDIVILCPPTAEHALWVERIASYGVHVLLEKPFGASTEEADRIISTMEKSGAYLAVNWPLAWYPPHVTAKQLIDEGAIGTVREVHYYDGNRGPLWHGADKVTATEEQVAKEKPRSWFYKKEEGGGSLLDYLGYGVTLGTWYLEGKKPLEVVSVIDENEELEVDEHSITTVRYDTGLSKFETRWGTFFDPWTHQPQPKCGFVIVGSRGTISSYDFEQHVILQTAESIEGAKIPAKDLQSPNRNPVEYFIDCIKTGRQVEGPLSPEISRIGQVIVDAAYESAHEKRRVSLKDFQWGSGR